MSTRRCDCVTGGELCPRLVHRAVRVGLPAHGPVYVNLCVAHQHADDDALTLFALAKIDRKEMALTIRSKDIRKGLLIQDKATKILGTIVLLTENSVSVKFRGGFRLSCSRNYLKANYKIPTTPKHPQQ